MVDDVEYWIYHERQEAMLCGQHALNNLVQESRFSAGSLAEIAVRPLVERTYRATGSIDAITHSFCFFVLFSISWIKWNCRLWHKIMKAVFSTLFMGIGKLAFTAYIFPYSPSFL